MLERGRAHQVSVEEEGDQEGIQETTKNTKGLIVFDRFTEHRTPRAQCIARADNRGTSKAADISDEHFARGVKLRGLSAQGPRSAEYIKVPVGWAGESHLQ